jgi:glucose-6-phosphate 1-epimerase
MPVKIESDKVILSQGSASTTIQLFGATVTSWEYNGKERFFLSKLATTNGPKATRGGIPLVFPQYIILTQVWAR